MRFIIFTIALISCVSCKIENELLNEKKDLESQNTTIAPKTIELGENIKEINAYLNNVYSVNEKVYVDIDLVEIKFLKNEERAVINENSKIRTYEIVDETVIYSKDCKTLKPFDLIKNKSALMEDKTNILVGNSENGKMTEINFGCYE